MASFNRFISPVLVQRGYGSLTYTSQYGNGALGVMFRNLFKSVKPFARRGLRQAVKYAKQAATSDTAKDIFKDLKDTAVKTGMELISNKGSENPADAKDIMKRNISAVLKRSGKRAKKDLGEEVVKRAKIYIGKRGGKRGRQRGRQRGSGNLSSMMGWN